MKKLKIFLDPISDIKDWLMEMADKGYRLVGVKRFIYEFEKTNTKYYYDTQYIGNNSYKENKNYIDMLKNSGKKIYRAPINQGNLAPFKFRLRPLAEGSGKFANSFMDFNREKLIVESSKEEKLLTDNSSLADQYKKNRDGYLQGFIMSVILFVILLIRAYTNKRTKDMVFLSLITIAMVWIGFICLHNQINYKKYKELSNIQER